MSLVLQETRVQVKYQSYENWTKKQMKKSYSLKFDRYLNRNSIYWDLRTKLDRTESVKIYEIIISKFHFWP